MGNFSIRKAIILALVQYAGVLVEASHNALEARAAATSCGIVTTTITTTTIRCYTVSTSTARTSSSSVRTSSSSVKTSSSSSIKSSSTTARSTTSSASPTSSASTTGVSIAAISSTSTTSSSAAASSSAAPIQGSFSVASTILIFAKDDATAYNAYSTLIGYQIPYQVMIVPSTGITLPVLNSSETQGNYGGFVIIGEVSYDYGGGSYASAITTDQFKTIYDYQSAFGVRMTRIDVFPSTANGCTALGGTATDNGVYITNSSDFATANLKNGATLSIAGIWHYPATISDSSTTWEVAQFGEAGGFAQSTAIVINRFGQREQMVYFLPLATAWSQTSNFLGHIWVHFLTRGLYTGFRRLYFSTQIDDLFLKTALYKPDGEIFRLRVGDAQAHADWTPKINAKMPSGSSFYIEFGHNGNGPIQAAITAETNSTTKICNESAIIYPYQPTTDLEFVKPLGTGTDVWPTTPTSYNWLKECLLKDDLLAYFADPANRDLFAHVSHTFTHGYLNNSTYSDVSKEISFNNAFFAQQGFDQAAHFSKGLIPPAITGMHNGDAIKAWLDNGVQYVVGDNTRPTLRNPNNTWYPLISTVDNNGYPGLTIIPRWSSAIYYNCASAACTLAEWVATSGGSGDFSNLMSSALTTATHKLLGLYWDPYMFHQANLRQIDVDATTLNGVASQMSLLQIWTETIVTEMVRLTDWPMVTLKHDDLGVAYINRVTRDSCSPKLTWNYQNSQIIGATISNGADNKCSTPIPVTLPGPVKSTNGAVIEQRGNDPLTLWTTMSGSAVTFELTTPISLS